MALTAYSSTIAVATGRSRTGSNVVAGRGLEAVRRRLQLVLGLLWLLDAALQFQPYMFTKLFVNEMLRPASAGNPSVVADPMNGAFHLMVGHPVLFNSLFASVQLLIATGFFWRRSVRAALVLSIVWATGVWWIGEGFGGLLSGSSPFAGAPGAVVLYAFVALLVWPSKPRANADSVATSGALGVNGARAFWIVLWGATAFLVARPPNSAVGSLHDLAANAATGQPGWLSNLDGHLAGALGGHGTEIAIAVAVLCQLVAAAILVPRFLRIGVALAVAVAAFIWVVQGFGGIFTGKGTDPNTGPLLALVALTFWPLRPASPRAESAAASLNSPAGFWGSSLWVHVRALRPHARTDQRAVRDLPSQPVGIRSNARPFLGQVHRSIRSRLLVAMAVVTALVTGLTAAQASAQTVSPRTPAMNMGAGMPMSVSMPGMSMPSSSQSTGPSQSSRMICGDETRHHVAQALRLDNAPHAVATWHDHLYTCTYSLQTGRFVLSVKELPDVAVAQTYFEGLRGSLAPTTDLVGVASLGFPSFQTSNGVVVFRKDDKVLEVDARGLRGVPGSKDTSKTGFAYQIATDVLACWTGK